MNVFVDGIPLGQPGLWTSRTDLSQLFSESRYSGIRSALGVFGFDSSTLANGVHTIEWGVSDNQGGVAGIGSRYFTVANGISAGLTSESAVSTHALTIADAGAAPAPLDGRLDIGSYELVFDTPEGRREVRIVLNPKGSNRVGPQVFIDAPAPNQDVTTTFTLGGWAADLDSDAGPGIDAIHVWAYPVERGDPIFLGVAALGGQRPDVSAIHGERFTNSGYGLTVRDLPRGTYNLAVFAWSTVQGGFVPAKTVRVTVR